FKRQRISNSSSQKNKQNSKNPQENLKNSNVDKIFKIKWLSEFSWLRYDDKKMFCTICVKHKMKNKFATEGAINISKKSAVKEHVKCKDHIEAEKLETARIQMESLQNQIFSSDANARHIIIIISITYTNKISGYEFLMAIAKTIKNKIWSELSDAVAFEIMIDESTDITINKHLDVYASYVAKNGTFKTYFLCLLPLTDCDAESYEPSFTEQNYDELLMDIYIYSTSIISELKQQFPNRLLFSSMKILNLREWPRDSEDLLCFGDNELEDLLKYYEYPNIHNNIQSIALFD
ncbi:5185_t:CDS:2, partial [Funneliformis geosporum]